VRSIREFGGGGSVRKREENKEAAQA
jgi:hypothetical protein